MEDRRSDTEETYGSQPPPGDVSNQNTEEASAPQGSDRRSRRRRPGHDGGKTENPAHAREDTQSTGHPQNAG